MRPEVELAPDVRDAEVVVEGGPVEHVAAVHDVLHQQLNRAWWLETNILLMADISLTFFGKVGRVLCGGGDLGGCCFFCSSGGHEVGCGCNNCGYNCGRLITSDKINQTFNQQLVL